jgi:probable rRNA maturation factor
MAIVIDTASLTVTSNGTLKRVPFLALKEKILGKRYSLSIAFVPPKKAQALNMAHRNKDYVPNTLSFPLTKTSGEIVLCTSAMKKQYKDFGMDYDTYLLYIIIHSMLHLKGFDHGSTMEAKERKLLSLFSKVTNEATHKRRH